MTDHLFARCGAGALLATASLVSPTAHADSPLPDACPDWSVSEEVIGQGAAIIRKITSPDCFDGPQRITVVEVAGWRPDLELRPLYSGTCSTTSALASSAGALVAINGGFFYDGPGCDLNGELRISGTLHSTQHTLGAGDWTTLGWTVPTDLRMEHLPFGDSMDGVWHALGSAPQLLVGREVTAEASTGFAGIGHGAQNHPRSAIGMGEGGSLLFVTVDGRQPGYATGVKFEELAWILRGLGAVDALNLDGGGSTTLWVSEGTDPGIINDRYNGEEVVANALAIVPVDGRPRAVLQVDLAIVQPGDPVHLDANLSWDPDGDPLTMHWEVVSKPPSSGLSLSETGYSEVSVTLDVEGIYEVALRVDDGFLSSVPATRTLRAEVFDVADVWEDPPVPDDAPSCLTSYTPGGPGGGGGLAALLAVGLLVRRGRRRASS